MGKLLEFDASISDVKQINPLFSTCKVRVLYTGKNRNLSIITKDAVEKALPTLKNIPIVGEFSEENQDFKGHGGTIDLDTYKFIHTTKPYGVVPESATYEWEEVKGRDGITREYLTINGCYLWTGRYEEAYSVIKNGKGQSMEIEVIDGQWDDEEEAYRINNFVFSALCILGDEVEPAFEDASITAYSFNKDSFKKEFNQMLKELKYSLSQEKGVNDMQLKELLEKYSTTVEELTAKGLNFNEISEDELENKIVEALEIKADDEKDNGEDNQPEVNPEGEVDPEDEDPVSDEGVTPEKSDEESSDESEAQEPSDDNSKAEFEALKARIKELKKENASLNEKVKSLEEFKLNTERAEHEAKVQKMFSNFQLKKEDVKDIDIHKFSLEEIEEKCYAILGRKLASKKNFSKMQDSGSIRLPINEVNEEKEKEKPYGGLFEKYNK